METETWRPVEGWPKYEVSDLGRVRSYHRVKKTGTILKGFLRATGSYPVVRLIGPLGERDRFVHNLVADAFIGPCPAGHEVNHKDGIKSNPRLDNLEYLTPAGNSQHAVAMGLRPKIRRFTLSFEDAEAIRAAPPETTTASLARKYGVNRNTIASIRKGKAWQPDGRHFRKRGGTGPTHGPSSQGRKLSWDQVQTIKSRKGERVVDLAAEYDVHISTIYRIFNEERW